MLFWFPHNWPPSAEGDWLTGCSPGLLNHFSALFGYPPLFPAAGNPEGRKQPLEIRAMTAKRISRHAKLTCSHCSWWLSTVESVLATTRDHLSSTHCWVYRYVGHILRFWPLIFSPGLHWSFAFEDLSFQSVSQGCWNCFLSWRKIIELWRWPDSRTYHSNSSRIWHLW